MLKIIKTSDSSFSAYSEKYSENLHSTIGARTEALYKFINPCLIKSNLYKLNEIKIADIGFGFGYNSLAAIEEIRKYNSDSKVIINAYEQDKETLSLIPQIHESTDSEFKNIINITAEQGYYCKNNIEIKLYKDDLRNSLIAANEQYDAVFWDGFSTTKNPELWTLDIFQKIYSLMKNKAVLATYSSAYPVISGLLEAGFFVYQIEPVGRKTGSLAASKNEYSNIFDPLDKKREKERKNSTGILVYRDPDLNSKASDILQRYERDKKTAIKQGAMTIKQYRKKFIS